MIRSWIRETDPDTPVISHLCTPMHADIFGEETSSAPVSTPFTHRGKAAIFPLRVCHPAECAVYYRGPPFDATGAGRILGGGNGSRSCQLGSRSGSALLFAPENECKGHVPGCPWSQGDPALALSEPHLGCAGGGVQSGRLGRTADGTRCGIRETGKISDGSFRAVPSSHPGSFGRSDSGQPGLLRRSCRLRGIPLPLLRWNQSTLQ